MPWTVLPGLPLPLSDGFLRARPDRPKAGAKAGVHGFWSTAGRCCGGCGPLVRTAPAF